MHIKFVPRALVTGWSLLLGWGLWAQPLQHPYTRNDTTWYNREIGITRYLIDIQEGDPQDAIRQAERQGVDAEASFVQALAYAQLGEADQAMSFVTQSLQLRLPLSRYLVSGADYLLPLQTLPAFQQQLAAWPTLVHGPMLGNLQAKAASVWLRTRGEQAVWVAWSRHPDLSRAKRKSGRSVAAHGYTATLTMESLKPQTRYYYQVGVADEVPGEVHAFTTPPAAGKPGRFDVVFGGGAAYIPWHHDMWSTIASHQADALFLLGDNVYIDYPERPYIQQYCYHRRQSEAHWRRLVAQTPVYAIWDDHDFGKNDSYGGAQADSPAWKQDVLMHFKQQWVNPGYGDAEGLPGVFFQHQIGDVDFFFLDGRYYRQPSVVGQADAAPVRMLGTAQMRWLIHALGASTATFKVIISPVPWAVDAKAAMAGRVDTWGGYQEERKELFDFLTAEDITGVFLLSADRHRSDVWRIEREGAYPLYELESSRLTNTHYHPIMPGSLFGYNQTNSFGKLVFDTTGKTPSVGYEIYSINNELINRFPLPSLK